MRLGSSRQNRQKVERLEARITIAQKRKIEYAATLKGTSLSDFVIISAQEAADRTIAQHQILELSGEDRDRFVKALLAPPAPGVALKRAVRRHRGSLES